MLFAEENDYVKHFADEAVKVLQAKGKVGMVQHPDRRSCNSLLTKLGVSSPHLPCEIAEDNFGNFNGFPSDSRRTFNPFRSTFKFQSI